MLPCRTPLCIRGIPARSRGKVWLLRLTLTPSVTPPGKVKLQRTSPGRSSIGWMSRPSHRPGPRKTATPTPAARSRPVTFLIAISRGRIRDFGHSDTRYRHFVRFGIFGRERCQAEIVRACSTEPEQDRDTKPPVKAKRFGFVGVFAVDHDGMAIPDSLIVPAFGLAFERLRSGVAADLDEELEAFRRRMRATHNGVVDLYKGYGRRVDRAFVETVRETAAETLTWLYDLRTGSRSPSCARPCRASLSRSSPRRKRM